MRSAFILKIMNTDIFEWFCRNGLCDGDGLCEFRCEALGIRFKSTKEMVTKEFAESYEDSNEADA